MCRYSGLFKGLIGMTLLVVALVGCQSGTEDPQSLIFKQKEANAYLDFLSTRPDSAGLRLLTAQKLDSVGRYQEALAQIDTLLMEDSTKYGLWVARAAVLIDSSDTVSAQAAYQKALAVFPGTEALLGQAVIYARGGKDSCLKLADQLGGTAGYSEYIRGLYQAVRLDTARAFDYLDRAVQQLPDFTPAYVAKAELNLRLGQPEAALAVLKQGLGRNERAMDLLNLSGDVYARLGQPDSARRYYQRSLKVKPYQPKIEQKLSK